MEREKGRCYMVGKLTGMEKMLCTLFLCLFRVVVVRVDDLTEEPLLLLFSELSPDLKGSVDGIQYSGYYD